MLRDQPPSGRRGGTGPDRSRPVQMAPGEMTSTRRAKSLDWFLLRMLSGSFRISSPSETSISKA